LSAIYTAEEDLHPTGLITTITSSASIVASIIAASTPSSVAASVASVTGVPVTATVICKSQVGSKLYKLESERRNLPAGQSDMMYIAGG